MLLLEKRLYRHDRGFPMPNDARREELRSQLRQLVIDGTWSPGAVLPPLDMLAADFAVSSVRLSRALDDLVHDGYLKYRPDDGLRVVAQPPHLHHFGLLFHLPKGQKQDGQLDFYDAMRSAARALEHNTPYRFSFYHGLDWNLDVEEYYRLRSDLAEGRLGGIVFASAPFPFLHRHDIFWEESQTPAVAFHSEKIRPHAYSIYPDYVSWMERAVDCMVERERHHLALFSRSRASGKMIMLFQEVLTARSLPSQPYWHHAVSIEGAANCATVLMRLPEELRPDGIIIQDNHLVDEVLLGLLEGGATIGADVDVVAHCNYPCSTSQRVTRLGFNLRQFLLCAVKTLQRSRFNAPAPALQYMPPLFSDEVENQQRVESLLALPDLLADSDAGQHPRTEEA